MNTDLLSEARCDRISAWWFLQRLLPQCPALPIQLAAQYRPGSTAKHLSAPLRGSYNICFIITFDDGFKAVCRFPIFGQNWFRNAQTANTGSIIQYFKEDPKLALPIPDMMGQGRCDVGPYTVYAYAEGQLLSDCLGTPSPDPTRLRSNITQDELYRAYKSMADVMLELYQRSFPRIGTISQVDGTWSVTGPPLTLNLNELVRIGCIPSSEALPSESFSSTNEYFAYLAELNFLILKYQQNDAIFDERDCRRKYVARRLFRVLLSRICGKSGPFRLFYDDLRPGNVVVASKADFTITGVIDWDFAYAAPVEFSEAAPSWLLLEKLMPYGGKLDQFLRLYYPKLTVFLRAMRACEEERIADGRLEGGRLSDKMTDSVNEGGLFWVVTAMQHYLLFDDIYWGFLDKQFFGKFTTLEDRIALLPEQERDALDGFVQMKMKQQSEKTLPELPEPDILFVM